MMSDVVYHFSSTWKLPWILADGALQPTMCVDVGIGRTHFLWGTTDPTGDLTAAPFRVILRDPAAWRNGEFLLVRFTLPANAFLSWQETQQFEAWEPDEIAALIESDRLEYGDIDHTTWRLRRDPLSLRDVIKAETTGYDDHETETWHPFDFRKAVLFKDGYGSKRDLLGVRIGRRNFMSRRTSTSIPGLDFTNTWTDDDMYEEMYDLRRLQEEADLDAEYEDDDDAEYDEANE
jgi:hypothetical protein